MKKKWRDAWVTVPVIGWVVLRVEEAAYYFKGSRQCRKCGHASAFHKVEFYESGMYYVCELCFGCGSSEECWE